jgi:hypothetical protein
MGQPMTEQPLGVCRTADDLRRVLRARFAQLGVSFETVDAISGLPTRYTAKVLGLQPTRRFGQFSLDGLLGAAGIKLVAFEDTEALARVQTRLVPLQRVDSSGAVRRRIVVKFTPDFMREIGRLGGLKSAAAASKKRHLSEINRAKALKRWQRATA